MFHYRCLILRYFAKNVFKWCASSDITHERRANFRQAKNKQEFKTPPRRVIIKQREDFRTPFDVWSFLRWLPTVAGQIYIDQCEASPTGKCFEMNDTWKVVFWGFSTAKSPSVLCMIINLWNLNSVYVFNWSLLFSDRVFVSFYV